MSCEIFTVPMIVPDGGTLRINYFIGECDPDFTQWLPVGLEGKGDCRRDDEYAGPEQSRVSILINLEKGIGIIVANYSCAMSVRVAQKSVKGGRSQLRCDNAYDVAVNDTHGGSLNAAENRLGVSIDERTLRYSDNNRADAPDFTAEYQFVKLRGVFTAGDLKSVGDLVPSIDGTVWYRGGASPGSVYLKYEGDKYPSLEIYQDRHGTTTQLVYSHENSAIGPAALLPVFPNRTGSAGDMPIPDYYDPSVPGPGDPCNPAQCIVYG
jgi:hypothetical protein